MTARFRLLELLQARGMTQAQLAKESGVAIRTVSRLCRNETGTVALATLERIGDALGVKPGDLIAKDAKKGKRT